MARAQLTRSIEFPAGHRYYRSAWSEQENAVRFGKCTENLARVIWDRLAPGLPAACFLRLRRVRVREGRDLWSDYCG